jgi:hypothetical protein
MTHSWPTGKMRSLRANVQTWARLVIPQRYRGPLADRQSRRLLVGLGASSLGDGMSVVTIAWLAIRLAAPGTVGVYGVARRVHPPRTRSEHSCCRASCAAVPPGGW